MAKTWYRRLFEVYGISTFACRTRFGSYLRGTIAGSDWRAVVSDNAGKRCTFVDAGLRGNASTDIT